MTEQEKPKVGEKWRATVEFEVAGVTDARVLFVNEKGQQHRLTYPSRCGFVFEKIADAPPVEPGPGSIVLDAEGTVWGRKGVEYGGEFGWSPIYGGRATGGYRWIGDHEYTRIAHPARVLYDPSKDTE